MDTLVRWGFTSTGRDDGEEEAPSVHRRVQGRSRETAGGERQGLAGGGRRARGARQPAPGLAERAPGGRLRGGPGAAEGRGGRAGAAPPRGEAARAGEREPQARRGFFRPGGGRLMRYRFVAAERAAFPVRTLCRVAGDAVSGFSAWLRRGPGRAGAGGTTGGWANGSERSSRPAGAPTAARGSTPSCGRRASESAASGSLGSCARAASPPPAAGAGSRAPPTA